MKVVLGIVLAVGFASIVLSIWIAERAAEPTVVADPYEEGLRYDEHRHATDPTGGKRLAAGGKAPACDLQAGPCTQPLDGGGAVTFAIMPRPVRAMTDVEFTVSVVPQDAAEAASVTLSMPGMAMGETHFALAQARAARGVFRGKGVVVRCPSGRRDWAADVKVARAGAPPRSARFLFRVAE